jgi:Rod binding domain-containing protein
MVDNIAASALSISAGTGIRKPDSPAKIHDAAQQFEALLIGEMLKTSHEAGWDEEEAGQTGIQFGQEQFARMLASSGGLGLAPIIERGLKADAQ